jgi:hypothetical protein
MNAQQQAQAYAQGFEDRCAAYGMDKQAVLQLQEPKGVRNIHQYLSMRQRKPYTPSSAMPKGDGSPAMAPQSSVA